MKMKRFLCALLVCAVAISFLPTPAKATEAADMEVIRLENLEWEWVNLNAVEHWEADIALQTTNSINRAVFEHSIGSVVPSRIFEAGNVITFNCSYSPSSASMDFGVIDSTGRFYFINVKGGSICQTIQISQRNSYTVAIRNNSSQTVRVVGFVEY